MPPAIDGVRSDPHIFGLANELLDDIVSYLSASDQLSTVLSCTLLHDIACRQLYRHITVSSYTGGSNLFRTLARSKVNYASHTRTLHYGSRTTHFDNKLQESFTEAFPKLVGLVHLTLDLQYPHLLAALQIKKSRRYKDALNTDFCLPCLPRLRSFQLSGDMRLLAICQFQTIEELKLADAMTSDELQSLLNLLGSKGPNTVLKKLDLTFSVSMDEEQVACSMYQINEHCPSVEILTIQGVLIDALEMTRILATEPTILKNLRELLINKVTVVLPSFYGTYKSRLIELQAEHLGMAGTARLSFSRTLFGALEWVRDINSDDWKVRPRYTTYNEIVEFQQFPDGTDTEQLFWGIFYREPKSATALVNE